MTHTVDKRGKARRDLEPGSPLDRALASMDRRLSSASHDIPRGSLYHYTDASGLLGILKDGAVRATHYQHLNDPQEVVRGERLVVAELGSLQRGNGEAARVAGRLREHLTAHPVSSIADLFVAAFTRNGDQLSQWRAYARNGLGYSIGFRLNRNVLPNGFDPTSPFGFGLRRCLYREDTFRAHVRRVVRAGVAEIEQIRAGFGDRHDIRKVERNGFLNMLAALSTLSTTLKAPGFHEEQEYRLIVLGERPDRPTPAGLKELCFAASSVGVRPYIAASLVEAKTARLPLTSVRLGPAHNSEAATHAIEKLMMAHGYTRDLVDQSAIPFRDRT